MPIKPSNAAKTATAAPTVETVSCPTTPPACIACAPRTQDEVWLVSTRCLGCPDNETAPYNIGVMQYNFAAHQWLASSLQDFLAAQEPSKPDVFWIHGNRIEADEAREEGFQVYEQLTNCAPDHPIRFIIFSWPSAPISGLVEDARVKATRTNLDGYYLAWLVNQIDHRVPVDIIGYSFGARIATGTLHILGGGALFGRTLPEPLVPQCANRLSACRRGGQQRLAGHWARAWAGARGRR